MKLSEYWRAREAASFLGISVQTLKRWEKSDKLISYRHPVNNYRLYKKEDLERMVESIEDNLPIRN